MRKAQRARDSLRAMPIEDLIARVGRAGELYMNATLPMGDGTQSPDAFVRAQSASTGLPERLCRANMSKNAFVLGEMRSILTSLTRGLSLEVLTTGYGEERGVPISYQAQSPVLGLVLPSNSPACTLSGSRSSRCRWGSCSSRARRSRGHRTGWRQRSSRLEFRPRRSRSIPAAPMSARRWSTAAARSLIFGGTRRSIATAATRACSRMAGLLEDPAR
jgi:hypothetical protein